MILSDILAKAAAAPRALSTDELAFLLSLTRADELARLYAAAYALKVECCGKGVSVRGLVEAGNVCAKDCLYCGIRRSNAAITRYRLSAEEIVSAAEAARALGYAALVIQSGEIESEAHTAFIEDVLHRLAPLRMGVTLSLGEQTEEVFARWRAAGATRYLLRIETSNPRIYAKIHPADCNWARRVECLRALRRTGYQVGTGVMCALPGQTREDLAHDIEFFGEMDVDMIGMGPFIPAPDTPMGEDAAACRMAPPERLALGLKMIAVTRLYLHDVNIASATALQALADDGREQGIRAGANVLMPNVTAVAYRRSYQLYTNKPCLDEDAARCRANLDRRLAALGEQLLYNQQGDSRHFARRLKGI
ncbi:MAG: [FeFe] hydrogenase H-cluster radical SAM maturase HydE [Kiritimatiellia bacterium]